MQAGVIGIACALAAFAVHAQPRALSEQSVARRGEGPATCDARAEVVDGMAITWHAPDEDRDAIDRWCRAVGRPMVVAAPPAPAAPMPPSLEDVVVISWNMHLAEGRLADLIADLRAGRLTDGAPVRHFVLLVQELYRRGIDVPAFVPEARSAFAITPRDPHALDARDYANLLGLALVYVPSMRNGAEMLEDRGNAILSTEPLRDVVALELPFERQRRVAAGSAIEVRTGRGVGRLNLWNAHLEPLSAPSALWLFRNPRRRQVAAILDLLRTPRFAEDETAAGTVLGGDFNTIQGGVDEEAYSDARAWSRGLAKEDPRGTHYMGRLDYVFVRLASGWEARTTRIGDKYGSDHHPVLARFDRADSARDVW